VVSDTAATGISAKRANVSWRDFPSMFFTIRSPACLKYRFRFARLAVPRGQLLPYLVLDTLRLVGGAVRDQVCRRRASGGRSAVASGPSERSAE
jgi:hypothetical protein